MEANINWAFPVCLHALENNNIFHPQDNPMAQLLLGYPVFR